MKTILLLLVLASSIAFPSRLVAEEPLPFSQSAEGKILSQYEGHWRTDSADKSEATDDNTQWVLKGRWLEDKFKCDDGREGTIMSTYDDKKKCYICRMIDYKGTSHSYTGTWDPTEHTLTWTCVEPDRTIVLLDQMVDSDTIVEKAKEETAKGTSQAQTTARRKK